MSYNVIEKHKRLDVRSNIIIAHTQSICFVLSVTERICFLENKNHIRNVKRVLYKYDVPSLHPHINLCFAKRDNIIHQKWLHNNGICSLHTRCFKTIYSYDTVPLSLFFFSLQQKCSWKKALKIYMSC